MKVKEESEKVGLKVNIQKTKIMASGPITSWQIDGETVADCCFFFWAPKSLQMVTAAMKLKDACSLEENYDQPRQHIKKQRHYFANKCPPCQGYGFPVVMYGCESWTIKKAEHQRIDGFDLWCWRRLLRVPWTARRSNQSILKEISPEYSLEGLVLKLKLQYFGHLMRRTDSSERSWCWERWCWEKKGTTEDEMVGCHHWLNGHEFIKLWELVMDREAWHAPVHGVSKGWTPLSE